jgi:hypothetical protein
MNARHPRQRRTIADGLVDQRLPRGFPSGPVAPVLLGRDIA